MRHNDRKHVRWMAVLLAGVSCTGKSTRSAAHGAEQTAPSNFEIANQLESESSAIGWKHPLEKKGKLGSPLVEVTPFVFTGRLYLLENWQKQWEFPSSPDGSRFQEDEVRIRDVEADRIVSVPLVGHGLGMALVWKDRVYYTLYLHALGSGKYETRLTRSTDLVHWQDAPEGRPFVTFDPKNKVHPLRPTNIRETNASDVELCQWQGKTIVYFTGGDQHLAGDLQLAEFAGTPAELFSHFYVEPRSVVHTTRHKLRSLVFEPRRSYPEAFDSHAVECPMVFRYGGRWRMAYTAITLTDGDVDSTIGLADSDDLIHWTNRRQIVRRGNPGSFDHGGVSGPFVWLEGKRLTMTYAGFPRLGYEVRPGKHGLAWSDDLQTWTKSPRNPIHGPGFEGTWNDNVVYKTFVMKHEGKYWMFYNAHGSRENCEQIGLATSRDLIQWTEHPDNPLLRKGDPAKDRDHVIIADPWIMKFEDRYHMFYFGFDGKHARECLATSTDLLHWSKWAGNPVMDVGRPGTYDSLHCHKPCIVEADGVHYHFYTACEIRPDGMEYRAIALATSEKLPGVAYRVMAGSQ